MRRFTIFVLLATSAVPAMAAAQDEGGRQGRQDKQSEQSDNRPARAERAERAERPERAPRDEQRQRVQVERQVQVQPMQQQPVQIERQVQVERRGREVQDERQDGERGRVFGGRGAGEQDGQASRDERMQQYREQRERRAEAGGQQPQPQIQDGTLGGRPGRYRPAPGTNPALIGRPAPENRDARVAHRDRRDGVQWTSNWRNNHRYDWRRHRDHHRSIFRIGFYYDPFGYSYNRFGIGSYMYPSYYRSNYWISDTWRYRLPPAYGPYRWVRYHNDALMIDTWTGEVVDVIYGFFW